MPLTRHFYESDEVLSALYYCTSRRDLRETEFWCNECCISGYSSEAISTLFESWILQRGPFYLRWLLDAHALASQTVTNDMIMKSAIQLSSYAEWDNSLIAILLDCNTVDRVTPKTPPFIQTTDPNLLYFYRALYQGKARSAWAMSRKIPNLWSVLREYGSYLSPLYAPCFDILEQYEDLLGYKSDAYDIIIQCFSVLMLCLSDSKRVASFQERTIPSRTFTIPVGRKAARFYSIPSLALYGTRRGATLCTHYHVNGLYDSEKGIKGCPFWDEVLQEYQRHGKWVSDDAQSAFYDLYFPDDIPDEWSKEEKMKSHGQGLLNAGETMTLQKYAKIHFTKPCRLAPRRVIVDSNHMGTTIMDAIVLPTMDIVLTPLKRRYVI